MTNTKKKTYFWKHCFRRKDWLFNRKQAGLSSGQKELLLILCSKCKYQKTCLQKAKPQRSFF